MRARWTAVVLTVLLSLAVIGQNNRIDSLYRDRKFAQAAQALEEHLKQHPEDFPSRLLLGLCYQQAEDKVNAEHVLRGAVRLRPDHADARYFLARIQYLREEFAEAERNARLSMKLGGPAARAYNL